MFPKTYFILQNQFEQTDFDGFCWWKHVNIKFDWIG
jgi:hypothetical protein